MSIKIIINKKLQIQSNISYNKSIVLSGSVDFSTHIIYNPSKYNELVNFLLLFDSLPVKVASLQIESYQDVFDVNQFLLLVITKQ